MKTLTAYFLAVQEQFSVLFHISALARQATFGYKISCLGFIWLMLAVSGFAPAGISLWQAFSPLLPSRSG